MYCEAQFRVCICSHNSPRCLKNCDCFLCFHHRWGWTYMLHITHQLIIGPINWSKQATKKPTNQPPTTCLFLCSTICVQFGQLLACFVRNNPWISPSENHTEPRIATNSWHTFETFPNHLGSKSSHGKNWQIEKTFKQQETSNFIKLPKVDDSLDFL